ncbi:hypothetical protein LJ739_19005 [Aestuariibacter halophilus]|uniref:Uncharacterized protein n=1 Tax=Fluctibacter halophilus TaxID=226011 RepID=A0ABS8GCQ7_9ALTE|nr:hypothetical protein [Aestuariibacter halophilus]MCC2618350.1 hypothetical protein [Aestuariibacter halophilus]
MGAITELKINGDFEAHLKISSSDLWSLDITRAHDLLRTLSNHRLNVVKFERRLRISFQGVCQNLEGSIGFPQVQFYLLNLIAEWPYMLHFAEREKGTFTWILSAMSKQHQHGLGSSKKTVIFSVNMESLINQLQALSKLKSSFTNSTYPESYLTALKADLVNYYPHSVFE